MVHLTVCYCHVMYAFQSESTLYSCLNVKERLAWSRREICILSDCNWTPTHNHLVRKQTHDKNIYDVTGRDMIRTYSQIHHTNKYSQHSSIIWPVLLNGWVFVSELSGCEFESSWSYLNFRFCACFEQGVSWHLGYYGVWIHSEKHTWHDRNIQSNPPYK